MSGSNSNEEQQHIDDHEQDDNESNETEQDKRQGKT